MYSRKDTEQVDEDRCRKVCLIFRLAELCQLISMLLPLAFAQHPALYGTPKSWFIFTPTYRNSVRTWTT